MSIEGFQKVKIYKELKYIKILNVLSLNLYFVLCDVSLCSTISSMVTAICKQQALLRTQVYIYIYIVDIYIYIIASLEHTSFLISCLTVVGYVFTDSEYHRIYFTYYFFAFYGQRIAQFWFIYVWYISIF